MGGKSGGVVGSVVGGAVMGPLGIAGGAYLGSKMGNRGQGQPDPVGLEKDRLSRLMSEDNLQYLSPEEQKKYRDALNAGVAPQDALGYFKSEADNLEALIAGKRERSRLYMEQVKLLAETPGAKQTRNPEYLIQNAAKAPESILTAGQQADSASRKGTILS